MMLSDFGPCVLRRRAGRKLWRAWRLVLLMRQVSVDAKWFEQQSGRDRKSGCKCADGVKGDVPLTSFNRGHVGAVQRGGFGEPLLSPAARPTSVSYGLTHQLAVLVAVGCGVHQLIQDGADYESADYTSQGVALAGCLVRNF